MSYEDKILADENIQLITEEIDKDTLDRCCLFDNMYKCLRCELTFESDTQAHNCIPFPLNVNKQTKLKRVFKCILCDKNYNFPSLAIQHMKRHQKYVHRKLFNKCEVCVVQFETAKELKDHNLEQHRITLHQCKICDKLFKQARNLQYHMMSHSGEKPFQCELCGHKFTRADHLARHRRDDCNQMEFECDLCGNVYNTKRGTLK